jgi:transcriptional regulator with XRE-family HTH domain
MNNKPTIRQLRIRKGWKVPQLAEKSGVSVPTIYRIERGEPISDLHVSLLAIALGTTIDHVSYPQKESKG